MASIIVLQNGPADKALNTASELASQTSTKVFLVGNNCPTAAENGFEYVEATDRNIAGSLWDILAKHPGEQALVIDSRLSISSEAVTSLFSAHSSIGAAITLPALRCGVETTEMSDLQADSITNILNPSTNIAFGAMLLSADLASEIPAFDAVGAGDSIGMAAISAIGMHLAIDTNSVSIETDHDTFNQIVESSNLCKAQILRQAVNSVNIEELFPNHAWAAHGTECAAACYHTLSALFIRLNDLDSALECLSLSDQLEDSPRSLALRGIIALGKGETLQAVANMVSSLQEYEKRKEDEEKTHYLTFTPGNLEKINTDLQSGLDALNQRDNSTALEFFSDAVFEFDSFYEDCGLKEISTTIN